MQTAASTCRHGIRLGPTAVAFGLGLAAAHGQVVPLGDEFGLNSYTTSIQRSPAVHTTPTGDFVVVWVGASAEDGKGVQGQRFASDGDRLGGEFQVNSFTTQSQDWPAVHIGPGGDFVVVWEDARTGGVIELWGRSFSAEGVPRGDDFRIGLGGRFPDLAAGPSGEFVVVWGRSDQDDAIPYRIRARRLRSDGTLEGEEFEVSSDTTHIKYGPSIASGPTGAFVVVWAERSAQTGSASEVRGRRFASHGEPLGDELRVSGKHNEVDRWNDVAVAPSGDFMVVWDQGPDGSEEVRGHRFSSDGVPLGSDFPVGSGIFPAITAEPEGGFVVAWEKLDDEDDTRSELYVHRFLSVGDPVGGAFRVNSHTASYPSFSGVGAVSARRFVVVWDDGAFTVDGQDGSLKGVWGQLLDSSTPLFKDGFESGYPDEWSSVIESRRRRWGG